MTILDQTTELALSAAMREGSMAEHQAAEDSSFMADLLGGKVNERGYADYRAEHALLRILLRVGRQCHSSPFRRTPTRQGCHTD